MKDKIFESFNDFYHKINEISWTSTSTNDYLNDEDDGKIIVTDKTIKEIVKQEIKRLGNKADLNHIDVSQVTDMAYMFKNSVFNGDISKWNVTNVKNMRYMFANSSFNGDISKWNVANVEDMEGIFKKSSLEKNPPGWYKE